MSPIDPRWWTLVAVILAWSARQPCAAAESPVEQISPPPSPAAPAPIDWQKRELRGWTLFLQPRLLAESGPATDRALQLLDLQLKEITEVLPAAAVRRLREVPLWFSPEYPGIVPRAEYHPAADWLRANRRDPAMARGVEFSNVRIFEAETKRMPNFTLHELAHAYHDRFLAGAFENGEIRELYERARRSGTYDRVERTFGGSRPNTFERAYAMTNPMEYFAETTEAFFSRNDFFPFNREELERHDPAMAALLPKLWEIPTDRAGRSFQSLEGTRIAP